MIRDFTSKQIAVTILVLKSLLIAVLVYKIYPSFSWSQLQPDFWFFLYIVIGFFAQIIDGTLGMAYGVSCSTFLLQMGVTPRVASASVHTAEVFTTGVSGLSHLHFNNLDKKLFMKLVITGVLGAVLGAWMISSVFDGSVMKPFIAAYLLILGVVILYKGIQNKSTETAEVKHVEWLALVGGFLDSVGGGGWGPIVTSNLIHKGTDPRSAIGTVNTVEFFVSYFSTGVFLFLTGIESWKVVLGLIIGGILAAPIGAYLAGRINKQKLMILIGAVIIITSFITIYRYR